MQRYNPFIKSEIMPRLSRRSDRRNATKRLMSIRKSVRRSHRHMGSRRSKRNYMVEKTAGFVLVNDKYTKVVMIKGHDGCYGFPKGHTEPLDNGDILRTAKRETFEEIGVKVRDDQIVDGFKDHSELKFIRGKSTSVHKAGRICKHIDMFLAVIPESTRFKIQKEELGSCEWVLLRNSDRLLENNLKKCGGLNPHMIKRKRKRMLIKTLSAVKKVCGIK